MNQELRHIGIMTGIVLLIMTAVLTLSLHWSAAAVFFLPSACTWAIVFFACWQRRALNVKHLGAPPYTSLGWANRMSIARGGIIAVLAGLLPLVTRVDELIWVAAALYSSAAIMDRVDGYIARKTHHTSIFGLQIDTFVDALGLVIAPLIAVALGKVHMPYLLASIAFYLFQVGLLSRHKRQLPIFELHPSKLRRTLAGFQMGFIAFALWPPFSAEITRIASIAFLLPLLLGFTFDWCVVSGKINPRAQHTAMHMHSIQRISQRLLQPLLRVVTASLLIYVIYASALPLTMNLVLGVSALLIALGFLSAVASIAAMLMFAWQLPLNSESLLMHSIIWMCVLIALLGAGRYSLFDWDDRWVNRHDGEA